MQSPIGRLANTKSGFLSQFAKRIVSRERATNALIHHDEAVDGERLIIHRINWGQRQNICLDFALSVRLPPADVRGNLDWLG